MSFEHAGVTHAACSACEQITRPALVGIGKVNTDNVVASLFDQFKAGLHGFVMLCFFGFLSNGKLTLDIGLLSGFPLQPVRPRGFLSTTLLDMFLDACPPLLTLDGRES